MEFYSAFNRPASIQAERGSEFAPIYEYEIDKKTGKRKLVKTGETNVYEKIQASLESTKIENIVKRYTQGDTSALMINQGDYIDISEMPTSMIELQNIIMKTKNEFMKLDPEIRNKFENSAEKYVSMYGSEEWMNLMGLVKENTKPKEETKKKEVKEESTNE